MREDVQIMNDVDAAIKAAHGDLRRAMGNVQALAARYGKETVLQALACNYTIMLQRLEMQGHERTAA